MATKATFAGVILPRRTAVNTSPKHTITESNSASVEDSTDLSDDYSTPATSTAATPIESKPFRRVQTRKTPTSTKAAQLRESAMSLSLRGKNSGKRTYSAMSVVESEDTVDMDLDAKLAARLQAQEYEEADDIADSEDEPLAKRRRGKSTAKMEIDDSDDDDDLPLSVLRKTRQAAIQTHTTKSVKPSRIFNMLDTDASDALSSLGSMATTESEFESGDDQSEADEDAADVDAADAGPSTRAVITRRPHRMDRRTWQEHKQARRTARERARLEKQHPNIKTMWVDLENQPPLKPVPADQPEAINRKLKKFQLEGLNWMVRQEQTQYRGGLLGDEMGMGKTIQAVSLIMSDYPAKQPTLVVVPPVALMQWQAEINDYTSGKLKVLVYHISANPKCKTMGIKDLKKYDVIMVSYSSLESMYRKESKGWNRSDGIVKEDSVLHAIHYHRVILDEAHSIKSRTTGVAKACFALDSDYKWCLSGTPVQNRIGEFFSLLRFLNIKPFACYFCKECSCAELHWAQDEQKRCKTCSHSGFNHVSVFNQEILNPITSSQSDADRKRGFEKLRLITDRIMLRRLKRDHTSSMELPPKDVIIHNEFFGEVERDFSQSIMSNSTRKFDTYVSQGVMLNNYANIFGLIMQMRQVANHPDLILRRHAEGGQNILVCCICDEPAEEAIRSRCRHEFCRQCAKNYVRSFDDSADGEADCPRCHIPLVIDWDQPDVEQDEEHIARNSIINRIKMEDWTSSTKIEMLVYDLYKLRSKKQTHKSIVFSQFTSMLQLVQWRLQKSGFTTVLLDGSMSPAQRQKSIEYFMNNVDVEVFLVSLKAGGVALNLTEASRVFIIDPWWNPAAEWQSADRCHRIGQRRPCVITRLCIEDSVESRMVLLQEKKANMINGTINNDRVAMDKLTPEDMQFLFRGS